jgi:P-type conjugative transfer protein TrbJ
MMRWIALTIAILLAPHSASAQWAVVCANCSSIFQQVTQLATETQTLQQEIMSYQNQLREYALMVRNTTALPEQVWNDVRGEFEEMRSTFQRSATVNGQLDDLLHQLADMTGMPDVLARPYRANASSLTSAMRSLGLMQDEGQRATANLMRAQEHARTASGQMQAITAGNELLGNLAEQQQRANAVMMQMASISATATAAEQRRQQIGDVSEQKFFGGTYTHSEGRPFWGELR